MVAPSLVLIDTCVWVPFFNRKPSLEKTATTELLKTDRAALIGPVLMEILHGFRRDEEADRAASTLFGIHGPLEIRGAYRPAALTTAGHSSNSKGTLSCRAKVNSSPD